MGDNSRFGFGRVRFGHALRLAVLALGAPAVPDRVLLRLLTLCPESVRTAENVQHEFPLPGHLQM